MRGAWPASSPIHVNVPLASTEGVCRCGRPSRAKRPLNNTDNPEEGRGGGSLPEPELPRLPGHWLSMRLFGQKLDSDASYERSFFQQAEFNVNTSLLLKSQTWPWLSGGKIISPLLVASVLQEAAGVLVTDLAPQLPHWGCSVSHGGEEATRSACPALPCVGTPRKMVPPLETTSPSMRALWDCRAA